VDDRDAAVTHKVRLIECEDVRNPVDVHCCCEPRIMHLHTAHSVANDQDTPHSVNLLVVRQHRHSPFNCLKALIGFRN
jgi:hypothetical protein